MKKVLSVVLAMAMLATVAGCGGGDSKSAGSGSAKEITLSLAHTAATSHPHNVAAELFAKEVSDKTGGKVKINVYPAGELGDQPALLESCFSGGDADIVVVSQSNMATMMPKLNALSAPFLFKDYDHAHRVIDGYVMDWINKDIGDKMNMRALSMFDYGFRHVTTKGIPVNSAADLKNVKIRVPGSAGLLATFDALGSNTQTIAYSELYQSLKQGVVDAEENPVATILADSYFECQDQLALTGHFFDMQALLINKEKWDSLTPEYQKAVQEAAVDAQNKTRELIAGGEKDAVDQLKAKGMNVTTPDKKSFIDAMAPAYAKIASLCGQEELDNLRAAVEKFAK